MALEMTILGSGGATQVPRPFCKCKVCHKARKFGHPYKRNSSSIYINKTKTLIDCGESIADSLNHSRIYEVDNLFITHWHPDHTFGLRLILESNFNFTEGKPNKAIKIYIPTTVYGILRNKFPVIDYYLETQKTGILYLVEDGEKIEFGNESITIVGYTGYDSEIFAYLIEGYGKRVLYAPCDTISFKNYRKFKNLDLLIHECGLFSYISTEISFGLLIDRIKEIEPQKTILTHIEEEELRIWGENHLLQTKKNYNNQNIDIDFAFDGMLISV